MNGWSCLPVLRLVLIATFVVCVCVAAFGDESQDTVSPAADKPHALDPVIAWAEDALEKSSQIKDYTALLIKRERVGDRLQAYQYLQLKVRHEPFSIYLKFLKPAGFKGRETIFVEGQNDGMLWAHATGELGEVIGTVSLAPEGRIAMVGQRHPLTMIGFKNLGQRLLEAAKLDRRIRAPCDVKFFEGAKVNGRETTCIQVVHPTRRLDREFSSARVFIDRELGIPIRYEGYTWPDEPGGEQLLVEEYTYSHIQLNVGLTDQDFDPTNPAYDFE